MNIRIFAVALLVGAAAWPGSGLAAGLKPFILASQSSDTVEATVDSVTGKLKSAGFTIAGAYAPYDNAAVVVVTNDALKAAAGKSAFGAYGAAMRVSVTKVEDQVQVAYTDPTYLSHAYRMNDDLADARARLEKALGGGTGFGAEDGMSAEELRDYQYMFGMEYFTDQMVLNKFVDYEGGLKIVEANLEKGKSGLTKVYRIDIPGKKQTVFGVAMAGGEQGKRDQDDAYLMSEIDFKDLRSTPHLPYELIVDDDTAYALSARFRIAINFPDLAMMGPNSFMNIMGAPDAIRQALTAVSQKY